MRLALLLGLLVAASIYFSEPPEEEEGVRIYNEQTGRIEYLTEEDYLNAPIN